MVPTNKQPHLHYLSAGQTTRNSKSALCTLIASRISTHNYLNDVHSNSLPGTKTDVNVYSIDTEEVMVIVSTVRMMRWTSYTFSTTMHLNYFKKVIFRTRHQSIFPRWNVILILQNHGVIIWENGWASEAGIYPRLGKKPAAGLNRLQDISHLITACQDVIPGYILREDRPKATF